MLPKIVIIGRPNVGKSTLFNRLANRRLALVADTPGLTRDAKEALVELSGLRFVLVDTGGLETGAPASLAARVRKAAEAAAREADLVLFVLDARAGILPADTEIADWLREQSTPVLVVANKAEGQRGQHAALEAFELGLGEPVAISAAHGEGIDALREAIAAHLPEASAQLPEKLEAERPLRLAIVGRPNVGKSTLFNRLAGEERAITGPEPGLTRDAVSVRIPDGAGGQIELIDTAGLRRRTRIEEEAESLAVSAAIEALKRAEVVLLVVDATQGLEDQDLRIARLIAREGRAAVVVLNKCDAVSDRKAAQDALAERLGSSLSQLKGIGVVSLSARTGAGVAKLLPAVRSAYAAWNRRIATAELNRWLEAAVARHPPPLVQGRRLKLRYITQPKARPPTFVLFGTRAEKLSEDYQRYLVNSLRETFTLRGTPIRLELRSPRNPFAESEETR